MTTAQEPSARRRVPLIDEILPEYDVRERHRTRVRASAEATYAAVVSTNLGAAPLARALLALRALPAALLAGREGLRDLARRQRQPVTLRTAERRGFRVVAERPPHEIVIGVEGRFWVLRGDICTPPPEAFARGVPPRPGTARGVWNFTARELDGGGVELATETRVLCADAATRRRFLPYWVVIRAGSGLIRRAILREIRRAAERGGA